MTSPLHGVISPFNRPSTFLLFSSLSPSLSAPSDHMLSGFVPGVGREHTNLLSIFTSHPNVSGSIQLQNPTEQSLSLPQAKLLPLPPLLTWSHTPFPLFLYSLTVYSQSLASWVTLRPSFVLLYLFSTLLLVSCLGVSSPLIMTTYD